MLGVEDAGVGWWEVAQSCEWRPSVQGMVAARIHVEEHDRAVAGRADCRGEGRSGGWERGPGLGGRGRW